MVTEKQLFTFSFLVVYLLVYCIGGLLQLFIGISNTMMTFAIIAILIFNYAVFAISRGRIVFNSIIFFFILYVVLILISGFINNSSIVKILVYNIFPLLPLSIFLFFFINRHRGYINQSTFFKLAFLVSIVQLPILLVQRYFYDFFMQFNFSGQQIARVDFLYGSFFLKSDHSLGFFLILMISVVLLNINGYREKLTHPFIWVVYLSITVFLAESTISKLFLATIWILLIFISSYNRVRKTKLFWPASIISILLLLFAAYSLRDIAFLTKRIGGNIETHFSKQKSFRFYELKTAKREHIVVSAVYGLDTKIIGDGPYSYFDITTGKFTNTIHFSQLIWTYFDLGLLGLVTVVVFLALLIKSLNINDSIGIITLTLISLVYSFYTNIFSEIGFIFSLFLIVQKSENEFNNNTVPRLAERRKRRI